MAYQVLLTATGRDAEREKAIPISAERWAEPRVVMSLPLRAGPRGAALLATGDTLRVGVELEVTVDGRPGEDAYGRPYDYSPRVGVELLLASDLRAASASAGRAVRLATRRPRSVGHTLHHYLAVFDVQQRSIAPQVARWDPGFVNAVVGAWHPDAADGQVLLIGENEPHGAPPQPGKGRLNAIRFRPRRPPARRSETTSAATNRLPLVKGRRSLVYSLPLKELDADDQLWFEARVEVRSRLAAPARISTEIFLADKATVTEGPGRAVADLCYFDGHVAPFNGTNCLPGKGAAIRKLGAMRIRREPGRTLYANLVATCSDPVGASGSGASLEVVGGYLRALRYPAIWTG
jgi:hypothetical protein